jgi:iron complex outermembrane receptor protein
VQTDVEYRLGQGWRLSGGYLYNRARVVAFDANPGLIGKTLPQVPQHRGSAQVEYANPRYLNIAFAVQASGQQFDDDQNVPTRVLPKYALLSLSASRRVSRNLEVFAGVQNLTDREYFVGTLPTTIGTPRLVNGGLRIRFAPRETK